MAFVYISSDFSGVTLWGLTTMDKWQAKTTRCTILGKCCTGPSQLV